jgi:hypothetical protein
LALVILSGCGAQQQSSDSCPAGTYVLHLDDVTPSVGIEMDEGGECAALFAEPWNDGALFHVAREKNRLVLTPSGGYGRFYTSQSATGPAISRAWDEVVLGVDGGQLTGTATARYLVSRLSDDVYIEDTEVTETSGQIQAATADPDVRIVWTGLPWDFFAVELERPVRDLTSHLVLEDFAPVEWSTEATTGAVGRALARLLYFSDVIPPTLLVHLVGGMNEPGGRAVAEKTVSADAIPLGEVLPTYEGDFVPMASQGHVASSTSVGPDSTDEEQLVLTSIPGNGSNENCGSEPAWAAFRLDTEGAESIFVEAKAATGAYFSARAYSGAYAGQSTAAAQSEWEVLTIPISATYPWVYIELYAYAMCIERTDGTVHVNRVWAE